MERGDWGGQPVGRRGRSEGERRHEIDGGDCTESETDEGWGNQNSRGRQCPRIRIASGVGKSREQGIRGVLPSGGVGVGVDGFLGSGRLGGASIGRRGGRSEREVRKREGISWEEVD